jgi:Fic family protein
MSTDEIIEILRKISSNLDSIREHTKRLARSSYRQDLEKIASTPQRQEMWRLCNGSLSTEDIAEKIGVSTRSVQYFIEEGEKKGLIKLYRRGYPKRNEDFDEIPAEWKPYKKASEEKVGVDTTSIETNSGGA